MKKPILGPLCGDDAVVKQYWNARHDGPFDLSLEPSADQIANHHLEIMRSFREDRALILEARDALARLNAPKPGPNSTLSYDIWLALECLAEAVNGSVSDARKLFKSRVRPCISPLAASKRFTRARDVIVGPDGAAICAGIAASKAKNTPRSCD
jgi:hypothetical protein